MIVTVGQDADAFTIHESVLRPRSSFFDAAFNRRWQEGLDGKVHLPEDKPDIVKIYLQYLYSGRIHIATTTTFEGLRPPANLPEYLVLAELYVFGEKVQDVDFKNIIIDRFIRRMEEPISIVCCYPITRTVDVIYKGTLPGSPARRLMVDTHLLRGGSRWITEHVHDHNKEFLMDLSRALLKEKNSSRDSSVVSSIDKQQYMERN